MAHRRGPVPGTRARKGSKRHIASLDKAWRGQSFKKGGYLVGARKVRRFAKTTSRHRQEAWDKADRRNPTPSLRPGAKITFPGDHGVRVAGRYLGMEDDHRGIAAVCEEGVYSILQDSPEGGEAYTHYVDLGDVRPRGKSESKMAAKKGSRSIHHGDGGYRYKIAKRKDGYYVSLCWPGDTYFKELDMLPVASEGAAHKEASANIRWRLKDDAKRATRTSAPAPRTHSSKATSGKIKHANGRYEVGGGKWFGTKAKAEAYLRKHG